MQNWQKGRPYEHNMGTIDEELVQRVAGFVDQAKKNGKPFFIWHNPPRLRLTYLSPNYQAMMNPTSGFGLEEAAMAQLDDVVGADLQHLQDLGEADTLS